MPHLVVVAPDGVGEVAEGDDLVSLLLAVSDLRDGDVVTVTSKVASKAEGRSRDGDRDASIDAETVRVVARRGPLRIVRNRLGLTMAAAGVDASNVSPGRHLLLPVDPDATARRIREEVHARAGANVAVVMTDTAGRAWRTGQTDLAIGAAGLVVLEDFAGTTDGHGNELHVTAPAVADEIASAAELVTGKLGGRPFAVVRGRADLVLPVGDHGTGVAPLLRADGEDLFGLGAREAVLAALTGRDAAVFGAPASVEDLEAAVRELVDDLEPVVADERSLTAHLREPRDDVLVRLRALAFALGWTVASDPAEGSAGIDVRFLRRLP